MNRLKAQDIETQSIMEEVQLEESPISKSNPSVSQDPTNPNDDKNEKYESIAQFIFIFTGFLSLSWFLAFSFLMLHEENPSEWIICLLTFGLFAIVLHGSYGTTYIRTLIVKKSLYYRNVMNYTIVYWLVIVPAFTVFVVLFEKSRMRIEKLELEMKGLKNSMNTTTVALGN